MTMRRRLYAPLVLGTFLAVALPPEVSKAQQPAIPSLVPLKKKPKKKPKRKPAARKPPPLKPPPLKSPSAKPDRQKRKGPAAEELTSGEPVTFSLRDLRRTKFVDVLGPGTVEIEIRKESKRPRLLKVIVARRGVRKPEALLKVRADPVAKRLEVPEGAHRYKFVARPVSKKLKGELKLLFLAPGATPPQKDWEPPLVAATTPSDSATEGTRPPSGVEVPPVPSQPAAPPPTAAPPGAGAPPKPALPRTHMVATLKVAGAPQSFNVVRQPSREFHRVLENAPLVLDLKGPARLWLELRRCLEKDAKDARPVRVRGKLDGQELWSFNVRGLPSQEAFSQTKQLVPGVGEHVQLSVPEGTHRCELSLEGPDKNGVVVATDYGSEGGTTVVVAPLGASLSGISLATYGTQDLWPAIYEVNREAVGPDPDVVEVGTKLLVPGVVDAKEIAQWLQLGKRDAPPPALLHLAGNRADVIAHLLDSSGGPGNPLRRYLDNAVKAQVQLYLQAMVDSKALESGTLQVELGDTGGFDVADVRLTVDDARLVPPPDLPKGVLGRIELLPGPHRLDAVVKVRGSGGFFSYVSDMEFELAGGKGFLARSGKQMQARLVIRQSSDVTKAYKDRLELKIEVEARPRSPATRTTTADAR